MLERTSINEKDFYLKKLKVEANKSNAFDAESKAYFDITDELQLNLDSNKQHTALTMVVEAPAEMLAHVGRLFSQKHSLGMRPKFDLKKCDVVVKWGTTKDFLFEVNAELIKTICQLENIISIGNDSFNIPVIFKCGDEVATNFVEISKKEYSSIEELVYTTNEFWSADFLDEDNKRKCLYIHEYLNRIGRENLHGFFNRKYLRPLTAFDTGEF